MQVNEEKQTSKRLGIVDSDDQSSIFDKSSHGEPAGSGTDSEESNSSRSEESSFESQTSMISEPDLHRMVTNTDNLSEAQVILFLTSK